VYGLSGIFRDLSDTKKLSKQLIQSQKMMSLGAMAARMAHDLNNPLASLSTYTHILMTRTNLLGVDTLTENLAKVEEDADRIGQLVKDLLWYSSPSDHTTGIVDIHEVLRKSLSFAAYLTNMENIEIRKDYEPRIPPILANSKDLIQAFVNILTNAAAAMPGGGTIMIRTTTSGAEDAKGVLVTISDTGIGIPQENLPNIFERFFSTRSNGKGNGLGLFVAKSIIEEHHGEIHVESEVNKGTSCTLRLPIKPGTP
jgi:two-component system NtrC family sensor kinase